MNATVNEKDLRRRVPEFFAGKEIIFQPKMRDLQRGQTIVDIKGRVGKVTDFDPPLKQMFNNAQGFHAVCARFENDSYDDYVHWSQVFCLVSN